MYGDATSGVINVVTKGPSREFGGGIELQTSQFLDKFDYNRVGLNLQGPLVMTGDSSNRKPLIGFFLAGDFLSQGDNSPSNIGRYKIKDDIPVMLIEESEQLGLEEWKEIMQKHGKTI